MTRGRIYQEVGDWKERERPERLERLTLETYWRAKAESICLVDKMPDLAGAEQYDKSYEDDSRYKYHSIDRQDLPGFQVMYHVLDRRTHCLTVL